MGTNSEEMPERDIEVGLFWRRYARLECMKQEEGDIRPFKIGKVEGYYIFED